MKQPLIDAHLQQAFDWSLDALNARGEELEREDSRTRLSGDILVAIRHDLDHQPSGTIACPVWGPTPYKMTAIRQYIKAHIGQGVLYVAPDRDYVERLFYDLVALGVPPIAFSIMGETDADTGSPVVLTTHQALISPRPGCRLTFQRERHCIIDEGLLFYKLAWEKYSADLQNKAAAGQHVSMADQISFSLRAYGFPYVFLIDMASVLFYGESPLFRIYRS